MRFFCVHVAAWLIHHKVMRPPPQFTPTAGVSLGEGTRTKRGQQQGRVRRFADADRHDKKTKRCAPSKLKPRVLTGGSLLLRVVQCPHSGRRVKPLFTASRIRRLISAGKKIQRKHHAVCRHAEFRSAVPLSKKVRELRPCPCWTTERGALLRTAQLQKGHTEFHVHVLCARRNHRC